MTQNREPRNKPTIIWSANVHKEARICNGKKTISSANGVEKTRQLHTKNEIRLLSYTIQTNTKQFQELSVRPETIKILQEGKQ